MPEARVSWKEGVTRTVATEEELLASVAEAEATVDNPVVVTVEAPAGTLTLVVGDATGSSLVYFAAGYAETGRGSLHSVGDRAARDLDAWEPPQTAYLFGHHSELPRWMVVSADEARNALRTFFATSGELPTNIEWELD